MHPQLPSTPTRAGWPSRTRLLSALGVALSAVGCAPPGFRATPADVEPLRRFVAAAEAGQPPISDLQSMPPAGSVTGAAAASRVVLVGHSLGGPVLAHLAAQLAAEEPQRPVRLVLLATSLDPALEAIHPMQQVGALAPVRDLVPVTSVPFMQSRLTGAACVKTVLLEGQNHFLPWNAHAEVRAMLQDAVAGTCR